MPLLVLLAVLASAPSMDDRAVYARACEKVATGFDSAHGGFVSKGGVPGESAVELALTLAREPGSERWAQQGLATIAWTRTLRDTMGGGFVRHAADLDPARPRLDKPAELNARRLENLIAAWRLTSDETYFQEADAVADYFSRVLLDGRGGFAADQAMDADVVPEANGYAIHAWLALAAATRDPLRRDFALKSLDRIWGSCWVPELGLMRRGALHEILGPPLLVDQVEMGRAFVLAARLAERPTDMERARRLGDLLVTRFQEASRDGFRTQWIPTRDGKGRKAARLPAENARACRFLCELTALTGDARYVDSARRAWQTLGERRDQRPLEAADWALALRVALNPALPEKPQWPAAADSAPQSNWRPVIITGSR